MNCYFRFSNILSQKIPACVVCFCLLSGQSEANTVVDFEDLSLALNSFYNGADNAGGITSHDTFFNNSFTDFGDFSTWSGWSISNQTDVATPGFTNQYSAYHLPEGGGDQSANYGVSFVSNFGDPSIPGSFINLPEAMQIQSLRITNSTYAALDMKQGSGFSKKFGGPSGDDPDFFKLTITGHTGGETGPAMGTVDFFLADFRPADNNQDYIIDQWTTVDLTSLIGADTLSFSLDSSDVGEFGMNTPAYFAIDNITLTSVPEPATLIMMLTGLFSIFLAVRSRRRVALLQID